MPAFPRPPSYRLVRNLLDLPDAVLNYIIRLALNIPDAQITENLDSISTAITLCRTSNAVRVITTRAVTDLHLPNHSAWPNLKCLSASVWPSLTSVTLTVDRARLIPLLTWLAPATALKHVRITVTGEPHVHPRMRNIERHLLGKLFTSVGPSLETWELDGLDNHALLMSGLFHCTSLTRIRFGPAAPEDEPRTLITLTVLLALVNKSHLKELYFPSQEWYTSLGTPPTASSVAAACKVTWNVLWPSFAAGLKESAVNLPSEETDEKQIVSNFKAMSARLDSVNLHMQDCLTHLGTAAESLDSDDPPLALLKQQIPSI